MTDSKGIIEKLDIEKIGKNPDGTSISLIDTRDEIPTSSGSAVTGKSQIVDNDDIIPVMIRKINELVGRLNQFHGINTKD